MLLILTFRYGKTTIICHKKFVVCMRKYRMAIKSVYREWRIIFLLLSPSNNLLAPSFASADPLLKKKGAS
jgi:hypothetical protein